MSVTLTSNNRHRHANAIPDGIYEAGKAYWLEAVMANGTTDLLTNLPPVFCTCVRGGHTLTFVSSCGQTLNVKEDGMEYVLQYCKSNDTCRVRFDPMTDSKGITRAYVMDSHICISTKECVGKAQAVGRFAKDVEVINNYVIDDDFTLTFNVKDLAGFVANGVTEEAKE